MLRNVTYKSSNDKFIFEYVKTLSDIDGKSFIVKDIIDEKTEEELLAQIDSATNAKAEADARLERLNNELTQLRAVDKNA